MTIKWWIDCLSYTTNAYVTVTMNFQFHCL